ncbi:MAG: YraN family protein [Caldimicrobium sp.]
MKKSTRIKGSLAELKAEEYLKKLGFEILEKNFRTPMGEIDLIAKKGDLLSFIEVKSESKEKGYLPEEKVNLQKQEKIQRAAEIYLLKNFKNLSKIKNIRFDVVVINMERNEVRYYESAFFREESIFKT